MGNAGRSCDVGSGLVADGDDEADVGAFVTRLRFVS